MSSYLQNGLHNSFRHLNLDLTSCIWNTFYVLHRILFSLIGYTHRPLFGQLSKRLREANVGITDRPNKEPSKVPIPFIYSLLWYYSLSKNLLDFDLGLLGFKLVHKCSSAAVEAYDRRHVQGGVCRQRFGWFGSNVSSEFSPRGWRRVTFREWTRWWLVLLLVSWSMYTSKGNCFSKFI